MYALLMIWEAIFPARRLPNIPFWRIKGIIAFFFFFFLSSYLPLWYADWLQSAQFIDLIQMNVALAAALGILLYELGMYLWHRGMHTNNILWRVFHQMHHSAERLDTYGAFFFSPFDMIGFTLLGTFCFSFIMGLPPQAITITLLVSNFFSIFQHANIKTLSGSVISYRDRKVMQCIMPGEYMHLIILISRYSISFLVHSVTRKSM